MAPPKPMTGPGPNAARRPRRSRRHVAAVAAAVVSLAIALVPIAAVADVSVGPGGLGSASSGPFAPAVRGEVTPPPCPSVVVVGDSLTAIRPQATTTAFERIGVPVTVDARSSRRVPADVPVEGLSGVRAVRDLLAEGVDAACWVVALGSNDLLWVETPGRYGPDARGTVEAYLTMMTDAIEADRGDGETVDRRIFWVNLDHHRRYGPEATLFNSILVERGARDPLFDVIDWYALSSAHPEWFVDSVHVNAAGYDARAALVAGTIDTVNRSR